MPEEKPKPALELKDLYKTLLDTRNFEINLFWQRSNYFLVLNTAIAIGFFNLKNGKYAFIFALIGLLAAALWFWVCLGGKYWQARWEQRLLEFEKEHLSGLDFFGASPERIQADVVKGLDFNRHGWIQSIIYRLALRKPSVSYSMILLSIFFICGWIALLVLAITRSSCPFA